MRFTAPITKAVSITLATAALSLMGSAALASNCDSVTQPAAPSIPAPTERSTAAMLSTQENVKSYVTATREYLKCVHSTRAHNALVDQVYAVAAEYNAALQEFKASTR